MGASLPAICRIFLQGLGAPTLHDFFNHFKSSVSPFSLIPLGARFYFSFKSLELVRWKFPPEDSTSRFDTLDVCIAAAKSIHLFHFTNNECNGYGRRCKGHVL